MAVLAKINFRNNATAVGDFTSISDHLTIGQVGTVNGIGIHNQVAFQGNAFSSTSTPASDPLYTEWPKGTLERYWIADAGGGQIRFSGLTPSTSYTFYYMCPASAGNLDMNITDGTNSVTYDVPADPTTTLADPVALVSTADSNGDVVHTYTCAVTGQANLCALIIDDSAPAPSPTVTAPATVTPGATVSHSIANFTGPLTDTTVSDGTSTLSLASVTDTDAQAPALGNNVQYTTFGSGRAYTVSNATESAEGTTALNPPAGYALVTLGATFSTDEPSWLYQWGGTPATGDQALYPTADGLELYDDGTWFAPTDGSWTVYVIDASDGIMQSFPLTAGDPVTPSVAGKMTRRNVTLRTLTRRTLTARP